MRNGFRAVLGDPELGSTNPWGPLPFPVWWGMFSFPWRVGFGSMVVITDVFFFFKWGYIRVISYNYL